MAIVLQGPTSLPTAGPSNPVKAFGGYLEAVNSAIRSLVANLEEQRLVQDRKDALSQQEIDAAVESVLEKLPAYDNAQEVVRTALEKSLEAMVLNMPSLVNSPWKDDEAHFLLYHDALDIMVNITERQIVDGNLPMLTLEYLFEAMPVHKADQLFTYLETRRQLLTKDMVLGKGKALTILRTLNDLLRRSSKSTHTVFCGRIRLFLANTFPLGERSGVNLRGDFNKENVTSFEVEPDAQAASTKKTEGDDDDDQMVEDSLIPKVEGDSKPTLAVEAPEDGEEVEEKASAADEATGAAEKKETPIQEADKKRSAGEPDFYTLFWSLQRYFSDPPSLFDKPVNADLPSSLSKYAASFPAVPPIGKDGKIASVPLAAGTSNLTLLREGVVKMLDVFSDASKREKALSGASRDGSHRSKKDGVPKSATMATSVEDVKKFFFYPKYLTSKTLIDLEVANGDFRKQAMVQCLILFQYLHSFTEAARAKEMASLKHPNKSVLLPHRLSDADNQWISDLEARTYTEISRTPPDGEYFVKTVRTVLQAERNWTLWKAEACPQFEKPPLGEEAASNGRAGAKRLQQPIPTFPFKAGTPALSKLWLNEPKSIEDFPKPDIDAELKRYFEAARMQNLLIEERKQELSDEGKKDAAQQANDAELQRLEERKAAIAWRTLRLASATHLHLYGKIGVNNVERLIEEIAKPPPVLPHISAAAAAAAATLSTDASNAAVKAEEPADGAESKDSKVEETVSSVSPAVEIKVEEPQEAEAVAVNSADQATPGADADNVAETSMSGKRSREASGMAVDEAQEATEQAKKQKVDVVE
ncbi:hypothetical protein P389DRAFT_197594 [Cystobasidium minutum MCA 4210]|uniref:uncharacterized protein n=1 Tax=Cystobasidium minutum MCA 4210 TaxID=1397322 RepID=UPI0034CD3F5A|eukprot:jgi/Rhomi1/197594/gm1.5808_g